MVQAPRRPIAWGPLIGAMGLGAVVAGLIAWHLNLRTMEHQINTARAGIRKLVLTGGIPPNQDVVDYLHARQAALEARYDSVLNAVTVPPLAEAAIADPQLYFQEQLHDVQRMLERLATARSLPVPEQLGFPKALPPLDSVPRLLMQLALVKELAVLVFEQGVAGVSSFKIEDPETVLDEEEGGAFLTRLPVRVRLTGSLPQVVKILVAIGKAKPLIDLRAVRIVHGTPPEAMEVELALARYVAVASTESRLSGEERPTTAPQEPTSRSESSPARVPAVAKRRQATRAGGADTSRKKRR